MGEVLLAILMVPGAMVVLLGLELLERRLLGPAPPAPGEPPTDQAPLPKGQRPSGSPPRQAVAQPDGGREPGVLAGRYRLGEIIGLGGAATVVVLTSGPWTEDAVSRLVAPSPPSVPCRRRDEPTRPARGLP